MKMKNFAVLAGVAAVLAACGGTSNIVEPADLNDQRVFFAFNSSEIDQPAHDHLLKSKSQGTVTNVVQQNTT